MKTKKNENRKEMKYKVLNHSGIILSAVENRTEKAKGPAEYTAQKLKKAIDEASRKMESNQMDI
jgi:hypothetical protein